MSIAEVEGMKCSTCDSIFAIEYISNEEHLYECSSCGSTFVSDNSRCETCHKFSSKLAEFACPECQEGGLELLDSVWQTDEGPCFETEDEAVEYEKGREDRVTKSKEAKTHSDTFYAEYQAQEAEKVMVLVKQLPIVVATLGRLAARCPDDPGLGWTFQSYARANAAYLAGDMETAIREVRDRGTSFSLDRETLFSLCHMAALGS